MRFFSPLAVIAAVGLSVSAPAYAHPKLVSSTPAANASVSAPSRFARRLPSAPAISAWWR